VIFKDMGVPAGRKYLFKLTCTQPVQIDVFWQWGFYRLAQTQTLYFLGCDV
jgi:hypothetical protein